MPSEQVINTEWLILTNQPKSKYHTAESETVSHRNVVLTQYLCKGHIYKLSLIILTEYWEKHV